MTGTNGFFIITTPNSKFDLIDFQCEVQIRTTGVVITRSRFRGNTTRSTNGALLNINNLAPYGLGPCVTVYDSEFAPTLPSIWWDGISNHDYTAHRCKITGCVDPFGVYGSGTSKAANVSIYGCYTDLQAYFSPDPNHSADTAITKTHNDCVQWQGGANLTMVGNYFRGYYDPAIGDAAYSASRPNPAGGGPNNPSAGSGYYANYPKLQINGGGMQISGANGGPCTGLDCHNNWWSGCNRILTLSQAYPSLGKIHDNIIDRDQLASTCFNVTTGMDIGTSPSLVLSNNIYSGTGAPVVVYH